MREKEELNKRGEKNSHSTQCLFSYPSSMYNSLVTWIEPLTHSSTPPHF